MPDFVFPNLAGVLVEVHYNLGQTGASAWLENVRFEMQGGRVYVIGALVQEVYGGNWPYASTAAAIAWDSVALYYVHRDREASIAAAQKNMPRKGWFS